MTEKKTGAARATAYKNAYAAEHYKRVPLQMLKKEYEDLQGAAERAGESVNGFVRRSGNGSGAPRAATATIKYKRGKKRRRSSGAFFVPCGGAGPSGSGRGRGEDGTKNAGRLAPGPRRRRPPGGHAEKCRLVS